MKKIDISSLSKEIHFPIIRAIHKEQLNLSWWQKIFKFTTFTRQYEVMKDYVLYIPKIDKWLFVPQGFIFDNASVPKIFSNIYKSDGVLLFGSLPHDFGYHYQCLLFVNTAKGEVYVRPYTKKDLDSLFGYLCSYESGHKTASKVAAFDLRVVGFLGWNEDRKKHYDLKRDFPSIFL